MATVLRKVNVATVLLWGEEVGAVAWDDVRSMANFEYFPSFIRSGIEISPIMMPVRTGIYNFPALAEETYHGLPGLLSDSLPDKFGNKLIEYWLGERKRAITDFSSIERLCYIGSRGMGALEFKPAYTREKVSMPLEVSELVELSKQILSKRAELQVNFKGHKAEVLNTILRVGTSAGGARAKAIIGWNPKTDEIRSGQVMLPSEYQYWIIKFDGVNGESLGEPQGYGMIEFAYHQMAVAAGIEMSECKLLKDGKRAHFMTKRFDRSDNGGKIHMQSLCAIGHYDYNKSRIYGYEDALRIMQRLKLEYRQMQEMYRRMVFNVIARNQDDHTKNIAFLMNNSGKWRLSPAFDVVWAYNPERKWTGQHQMLVNGRSDNFTRDDLLAVAEKFNIKEGEELIKKVVEAVKEWPSFASNAGVSTNTVKKIQATHRLELFR